MVQNPTAKDLKKFKITLLLLPVIPAIILYFKEYTTYALLFLIICWGLLFVLFVADLLSKNIDNIVYKIVHKILNIIGIILSVTALIITWICAILPTALLAKLMKRDRLNLKKSDKISYWKDYTNADTTYENQF